MNKHAYLIIAHNNFYILEKLINLIDDSRNDIFIHIDKKVKNFKFEYFKSLPKFSNIYFIDRINVGWGAFSMIRTELNLFKYSFKNKYKYYHLISGVDLPIKSQDYIHSFFNDHDGTEFLTFLKPEFTKSQKIIDRLDKYYLLQQFGRNNIIITKLNNLLINIQKILNIKRYNNELTIQYGSNWASLTHDAVAYILENEEWIYTTFKYTSCCDEVYKQTLLVNNKKFRERLYLREYNKQHISYNMRHIDWKRGWPYIFRSTDYEELMSSYSLFARKFDELVDKNIVDNIYINLK